MSGFGTYQPVSWAIIPKNQVDIIPIKIAPYILKWSSITIIRKPIKDKTTKVEERLPKETIVSGLATTISEIERAMIVINKPMPAVMAYLRFSGILLTRASLNLNKERSIKIRPSTSTAVNATSYEQPISPQTVMVKNALRPIPEARATG